MDQATKPFSVRALIAMAEDRLASDKAGVASENSAEIRENGMHSAAIVMQTKHDAEKHYRAKIEESMQTIRESSEALVLISTTTAVAQLTDNYLPLAVALGMAKLGEIPDSLNAEIESILSKLD